MRSIDLSSCWAKLEWAERHRDALQRNMTDPFMIEAESPRAVSQYDPTSGYHIFRITDIPEGIPTLLREVTLGVGDVAHNLRSALDHLAYQLALAEASRVGRVLTLGERERIYFPIHTSSRRGRGRKAGWLDREGRYVREFGSANATRIKRFQPYKRRIGNRQDPLIGPYHHPLTLLNRISNRDKHRLPNVIAAIPNVFSWSPPEGYTLESSKMVDFHKGKFPPLKVGAELSSAFVISGSDVTNVEMNAHIMPTIHFPRWGQVTPIIDYIAAFVLRIIREFDPVS